jgi:AcrR family transcriptional regulator
MEKLERPRRADARRNRARIIASARKLFARLGNDAQMEEIAADSGLGMGTLYRHFPNKQALLTEIVRERFEGMIELAQTAERIEDPGEAFEAVLRSYLEAADGDAAFQLALLGSTEFEWEGVVQQKAEFAEIVTRIIERAVAAGEVRDDLSYPDFPLITNGVMATMYFKPSGNDDWRRHLELVLDRVRTSAPDGAGLR